MIVSLGTTGEHGQSYSFMTNVLELECFLVSAWCGGLKSLMVKKRGYECSLLKSPMARKGLILMVLRTFSPSRYCGHFTSSHNVMIALI